MALQSGFSALKMVPVVEIKIGHDCTPYFPMDLYSGGAEKRSRFVPIDLLPSAEFVKDVPFELWIAGSREPISSDAVLDLLGKRLCPRRTLMVLNHLRQSGVAGCWCQESCFLQVKACCPRLVVQYVKLLAIAKLVVAKFAGLVQIGFCDRVWGPACFK